jgi:hypothetical protein
MTKELLELVDFICNASFPCNYPMNDAEKNHFIRVTMNLAAKIKRNPEYQDFQVDEALRHWVNVDPPLPTAPSMTKKPSKKKK